MAAATIPKNETTVLSTEPIITKTDDTSVPAVVPVNGGVVPEKPTEPVTQDNAKGGPKNGPNNSDRNQQNGSGFKRGNNKSDGGRGRSGGNDRKADKPSGSGPNTSNNPTEEKKFSTLCRLFVGNLSQDTTEQDISNIFGKFTDAIPDVFMGKMFAFVRLDTKANAEKAKSVDGTSFKGRILRVRSATKSQAVKVKNLGPHVSNELLHRAFERFGEIDMAVVAVDEKGRPCGEGLVYFARKQSAQEAQRRVNDGIFLLGASPRPVVVECMDDKDMEDGMSEIHFSSRQQYQNEISEQPHFAKEGTLEYDFGKRWKQLLIDHQTQIQQIERIFQNECQNLEKEMEKSVDDFEINKIKQTIAQETMKMRQLEERKAQRRPGGGPINSQQQQQNQMMQQQQNMPQQQGLQIRTNGQQQLSGLPPVPPPGFGLPFGVGQGMGQGLRTPGQQFMEPFGLATGPGPNMLVLPNGNFMPSGPMGGMGGQGLRMPGQYGVGGGAPNLFEQQHFDPNIANLGQRQADFKRVNDNRGGDNMKRPRN